MARAHSSGAQRLRHAKRTAGIHRNLIRRLLSLSAALPVFLACPAWAAKWELAPAVSVGETFTDNLSLAPDASKRAEWVTQVIPEISIAATGARLRFKADYAPEVTYYAQGQQDNQVYQRLNATGNAELAKQLLFFDAGAKVDQQNVSLQAPITTNNVNTTGNRATVQTYFASPYIRRDFGSEVEAEARFTYNLVSSDSQSTLSNSAADRINLRLGSGPAYKLLVWSVDYARETIDYDSQADNFGETVTARARRLLTPSVGLLLQGGYDYFKSGDAGPALDEPSWSAGIDWTPSPRTVLAATAGRRFNETAYSLDFKHRTRLTTWSAAYSENVTTARSEFFAPATAGTTGYLDTLFTSQFPDPTAREKAVEQFIDRTGLPASLGAPVNFFSSQFFLVKRWQGSIGLLGVRNVLIVNAFRETSEVVGGNTVQPSTGDFAASSTVRQTGTSFQWNWRMTAQNAWNLGGTYGRVEFPGTSRTDNLTFLRMGLVRQFEPRLFGSLNYRKQRNDSNDSAFSYTENAVFATLRMRF